MKNNMKIIRTKKGITQKKLSRETEISLTQIRNIENGRSFPTLINALKIKKALQIKDMEELFDI